MLDKLPKSVQPKAKQMLHEIYLSPGRGEANKAFDLFVSSYEAKYPKATECLANDRVELLRFYDFRETLAAPANDERDRERVGDGAAAHGEDQGSGTRMACLTMVFKLMESASRRWRRAERLGPSQRCP